MTRRDALISAVVLVICSAILVAFTDVELRLVRWVTCGPLASAQARQTLICTDGN
jgi:hypothetical protein